MRLLKTPEQCFSYEGGAGLLDFNNLKWYWPSKRKLVSFLPNMVSNLGPDSWNWSKLETVLYRVAARLHTSIAPVPVNSFKLSNISSHTEHSRNTRPEFSNNGDSLYSLQWELGLGTTYPYSSLDYLNRWSHQIITRDCNGGFLCMAVSCASLTNSLLRADAKCSENH